MKYLVKLKPLEPFIFGGEQTFGVLGDKEAGSYLVRSRQFPQQTAVLGMLRKEVMTQAGLLTRKRKGEWVDRAKKREALKLVGHEKFSMTKKQEQDLGVLNALSPLFLMKNNTRYIKKVDIDTFPYVAGKLEGYDAKKDIYDNFVALESRENFGSEKIFKAVEQTGNKKGGEENSLFKKTSYLLQDGFEFAFYVEVDFELKNSMVTLGADRSAFMMRIEPNENTVDYVDSKGYMTLLSDAYVTVDIKKNCDFAITSEISHRNLKNIKHATKQNSFEKSETLYLYEKGSIFMNPSDELLANLDNKNLQKIGYNIYTIGEQS